MRLLAFSLLVALVLGCTAKPAGEAAYSGAFAFWLNKSVTLNDASRELEKFVGATGDSIALRARFDDLVITQTDVNNQLRVSVPPARWQERHAKLTQALDIYDAAISRFNPTEPLPSLMRRLLEERAILFEQILRCYADSPACDKS